MRRLLVPATSSALLAGCGRLDAATTQGREIGGLWQVVLWAGIGVAAVVYTLIIWATIRYRRRPDEEDLPPQFRANIPLEVVYTLVPILIVAALFVLTYRTETAVEDLDSEPPTTVAVEAFNWSWRFTYEGTDVSIAGTPDAPPEAVLPVGETVRIRLTASDVIHSFYLPDFLFKRDAIPGRTTEFDLTLDEPGVYRGQCAEFCGLDHWRMRFTIRAVPRAEFEAWLAEQA
jgi:cytochrome c oxidase subunit II